MIKQIDSDKNPNDTTLTRTTWRLVNYLKSEGRYGESLEDVIWRLLGQKELTKEQSKGVKKASYEESL